MTTGVPVNPLREAACVGRRCVVVGSAPGVRLPAVEAGDMVMAANGGAGVAKRQNRPVHALLTTAHLFRAEATRQELATLEAMRGVTVGSLWVDEQSGPAAHIGAKCRVLGIGYDVLQPVEPAARARVCRVAIGVERRISTGVWAACLALASGASSVVLCGISLDSGHDGMPWDTSPRDHVVEDGEALRFLLARGNVEVLA
jgi:hypothetical protein